MIPKPGTIYTVQQGDTLNDIAARAYGSPAERTRIIEANGIADPNKIIVGQVLVIPVVPELAALQRRFSIRDEGFRLKLGGRILPVMAGRVLRTMDTPADGWSAIIAWEPGQDAQLDALTEPGAFPEASVYLDGNLMVQGRLYNVKSSSGNEGRILELEGFSKTVDIVDSHLFPPYQYQDLTLVGFCVELFKITGIGIIIDEGLNVDIGGVFKEEKISPTETISGFLQKLADRKSAMLSSTREGDLLITRANTRKPVIGTIEEGVSPVSKWELDFKGRQLFRTYRGVLQKQAMPEGKTIIAVDKTVTFQRIKTFMVTKGDEKDLEAAVRWERNKTLAEAMTFSLPIDTWYAPDGRLWTENSSVLVKSSTMRVPNGFTFIIRRVEFIWGENGKTAVLDLTPPSLYTKQDPVLPWAEKSFEIRYEDLKST